jgi:hypothetical protein
MSRRDYDALMAQLGDEDAEDRMMLLLAAEARAEEPLPEAVSAAVLKGDGILRALRVWRGMTQVDLARAAEINQGNLSELENRAKSGTVDTLGRLAKALNVPNAWLR